MVRINCRGGFVGRRTQDNSIGRRGGCGRLRCRRGCRFVNLGHSCGRNSRTDRRHAHRYHLYLLYRSIGRSNQLWCAAVPPDRQQGHDFPEITLGANKDRCCTMLGLPAVQAVRVQSTAELLSQFPALGTGDLRRREAGPHCPFLNHQVVHLRLGQTLILVVDDHVV